MELLKFEAEALTNDGGIRRRIKVKGDGYSNPNDGATVDGKTPLCVAVNTLLLLKYMSPYNEASVCGYMLCQCGFVLCYGAVHLEGSCGSHVFDSRDVRFIVGEAQDKGIPLGVDRAMAQMQKGECCILHLKPK